MRFTGSFKLLPLLAVALLSVGCAKNTVQTTSAISHSGLPRPDKVIIYDFAVSPADVTQNSSLFAKIGRSIEGGKLTDEQIQVGREVADALASELTVKIAAMGLNPQRSVLNTPPGKGAILITGQFVNIDEGNSLRRNVIGLGAGKSSVDSRVQVMAAGRSGYEELISFDAHSDSGNMPGAAVMGPAGAAAGAGTATAVAVNAATGAAKSYKSSTANQAKDMAEKIAAELAKYFVQQGWISASQVK